MSSEPTHATAEVFLTAFLALPKAEKQAFIAKLFAQEEFVEDLLDIVTIEQRRDEPSRSLEDYLVGRAKHQ
ncbi:MAG: hypothetical protein BWK79_05390 [Beggiatoa sp. IS2]|nr:MAG: hypothetical protein BWK79_05390 [Beggiatoa sp. IS2]